MILLIAECISAFLWNEFLKYSSSTWRRLVPAETKAVHKEGDFAARRKKKLKEYFDAITYPLFCLNLNNCSSSDVLEKTLATVDITVQSTYSLLVFSRKVYET